jgi:AraC family transcriptional regulator, regulatory protein of adaptative response / DNA-3-methyladenine glycosylase II
MLLERDCLWPAIEARDPRFDGWVFCGVTTTGIYCRPSCPARTPKRENVELFATAAAAQAAGLRACKRCRPDATPGSPEWDLRADVVGRAMRLIADGVADREGVAGLARALGCSDRHVQRQMSALVGVGPSALARAERTARRSGDAPDSGAIELRLPFRAPLDAHGLIGYLARRAVPGVEEVVDGRYRRSLRLPNGAGVVELEPRDGHVHASFRLADLRDLAAAAQRCRALLDLDSDPQTVLDALGADRVLGSLISAASGRRVPGHPDAHELAARAVLGQQISLEAAATLAGRLVRAYGEPLERPSGGVTHLFPSAATLAQADPERLPMPGARRRSLIALAAALATGGLVLDAGVDRADARRRMLALPGIGPWTAEYVAMRSLRDPDAFLPTDLGVRRALERLGLDGSPLNASRIAEAWRPYRAYALQHLWALLARPASNRRATA